MDYLSYSETKTVSLRLLVCMWLKSVPNLLVSGREARGSRLELVTCVMHLRVATRIRLSRLLFLTTIRSGTMQTLSLRVWVGETLDAELATTVKDTTVFPAGVSVCCSSRVKRDKHSGAALYPQA